MRGLERVNVEFGKEGGLEPMLARLRDRHDAIEQVNKLYESGAMPLALAARAVGRDPVETLVGIAGSGIPIRSCEGSHLERGTAFAAINANEAKGCVVDVTTLHIIRRLNLENAVVAVCGPIGIVEGTVLHYQHRAREPNLSRCTAERRALSHRERGRLPADPGRPDDAGHRGLFGRDYPARVQPQIVRLIASAPPLKSKGWNQGLVT